MGLAWLTPCLPPPDEGPPATLGSAKSVFSRKALVRMQLLKDVVGNDTYQINNKYDSTYAPLPVEEIIRRAEYLINEEVSYDLLGNNCEHFVTLLRYGEGVSEQVGDMGEPPRTLLRAPPCRVCTGIPVAQPLDCMGTAKPQAKAQTFTASPQPLGQVVCYGLSAA